MHQQTLFTVIFFASFHEFVREAKIKVPKWWAKHRSQAEGEVSLNELHDDEGIVSQEHQSSEQVLPHSLFYFCNVDSYSASTG